MLVHLVSANEMLVSLTGMAVLFSRRYFFLLLFSSPNIDDRRGRRREDGRKEITKALHSMGRRGHFYRKIASIESVRAKDELPDRAIRSSWQCIAEDSPLWCPNLLQYVLMLSFFTHHSLAEIRSRVRNIPLVG